MLYNMQVYNGKSRFNSKPFTVIASGLDRPSQNIKTGPMVQLTILPTHVHPVQSVHTTQKQHTVCGDCALLNRGCYVRIEQSIAQIYRTYKQNKYPPLNYNKFCGKAVRFGAWGEPSLIPLYIIKAIVRRIKNWTGYTHQWRKAFAQKYSKYFMASVNNLNEKVLANSMGWRTFRIVQTKEDLSKDEVLCPAQSHNVQCINCCLCKGNSISAKNVAVIAHGNPIKLRSLHQLLEKS